MAIAVSYMYLHKHRYMDMYKPEYSEELVYFRVPMEEWLLQNHLCKNTCDTPHINGTGVASRPQQNLRCTIPQCHNLERHKLKLIIYKHIY